MFAAAALAAWAALAVAGAERPNIVFVLVDDVGFNDVGYNNRSEGRQPRVRTPHIDALAEAGVKLRNYYVQPICTPTRAALMTGRYPFRYGVAGSVIGPSAPWGIPLEEAFLPQFFQDAGYATAMFGKWHLGFFTQDYLPGSRGFARHAGLYLGAGDHYSHERMGGYDWHRDGRTVPGLAGNYSGELVRDEAVAFIREVGSTRPFLLYLAFQQAHEPFQVGRRYSERYPELAGDPSMQRMAGMVSFVDDAVGEVVAALRATGAMERTILVFSSDNGAPGQTAGAVLPRNWPFRGKKKEVYEGGVRSAGFVHSPLLPPGRAGASVDALVHVTDWLPTLAAAASVPLAPRRHLPLDGVDLWGCILGEERKCLRHEVLVNFNPTCGDEPVAALRAGDLKLMARCRDAGALGGLSLYNLTADPSESKNIYQDFAARRPETLAGLEARLRFYGDQAGAVPQLTDAPPWQGQAYFCAKCSPGQPRGPYRAWEPWCAGPAKSPCPPQETLFV